MRFRCPRSSGQVLASRKLHFESLERRDLLAVMRIVDWNTLNGPGDAVDDANFQTIFQAIGNETVAGNTQRIDILALQETDPPGPGGGSIDRVQSILNGLYPTANYELVVTAVDGGGDSTGFVFDTTSVSLLESTPVGAGTLTHNVVRGKFRPADTFGESDFYVYSIHLKSGTTGSDATLRGSEAALLRADADSLNEGANVLFVGDFNMKGSSETAYANLTAAGPAQLIDVGNTPGNWFNDPAFKLLHSQDPQSTMDDRFDIQFATSEVFDGLGFEYIASSYHVFGNNGTHTFDGPITTGTGASVAVLNALFAASDHLPVVADYQVVVSTPKARITETLGGTKVVEGGLYDTYQVVLDTIPSANVSVTVTPSAQVDVGNGAGVAKVFTFTPANALTPQTVVVNALNDLVGEGTLTATITHSAASSDASYNGLSISNVVVTIIDNDAPTIVINEVDSDQEGIDAMEFVELYDGGVGNVSLVGKAVVFFNGNTNAAYRVIDLAGQFTDANGFFLIGNTGVPGVDLTFPNNTLQQGEDAVALYSGSFTNGSPVTTTNLLDAVVYNNGQTDGSGLLVLLTAGQLSVNENQNSDVQPSSGLVESLSRIPDGGTPRLTSTYVAKAPTPGLFNQSPQYGVQFVQSASRVDVQEGGATDTYQIALQTIPTSNVTITVDPDSQTNLGLGAGVAIVLTFTPANALIPQTVSVAAVDDLAIEGVHTSVISHTAASADSHYNGLPISNVVANIIDNDVAPPTSIVISEIMFNPASDESGAASPEWIEVVNTGTAATDLGGWRFDDEDSSNWGAIPAATILNPNQIAVFFDASFTTAAAFRTAWSVPAGAIVVGISWGNLANSPSPTNEILQLFDNINVQQDIVNFDDTNPWPSGAEGPSIYLKNLAADNNAGSNWGRSTAGVKAVAASGTPYSAADIGSPGRVFLAGDYNVNGVVDSADFVLWRKTLGQSGANLAADGSGPTPGTPNGVVDQADYTFWRSNFGAIGVPKGGLGSGAGDAASALSADGTSMTLTPTSITPVLAEIPHADAASANELTSLFELASTVWDGATTSHAALASTSNQTTNLVSDLLLSLAARGDAPHWHVFTSDSQTTPTDDSCDDIDELFTVFGEDDNALRLRWAAVL